MKERTRKSLAVLLALVLCAALLPVQAFALDMQADAPVLIVNTSVIGFAGQEWYVIGYDGSGIYSQSNTATLLLKSSGSPYGSTAFRTGSLTQDDPEWTQFPGNSWYFEGDFTQPSDYKDSTLQNRMVAIASGIPGKELALINTRTLTAADDTSYPITGGDVANQKLWPLSNDEWTAIGDNTVRSFGNYFWLRSPTYPSSGLVGYPDGGHYGHGNVHDADAARPAFNLDLSYVLFTSAASGASGKSAASAGSGLFSTTAPTGAVKFTVKSASQELDVTATEVQATQNGATLTFGYTDATTGTNQYVSCVLLNGSNEVAYYGKLADSSSDASGDLSIPLAGVANGTYTLRIFSEEANGDNYTDFCSEPVSMTLNVSGGVGTVSSFGGTELDTTAPVLSAGSADRTASAVAAVSFSSDEAGTYYWQIDGAAPANAAALAAAGTNATALTATEQTISLTTLTAGAHTVYVAAKDGSGNVSNLLTITVPAYSGGGPNPPGPAITGLPSSYTLYTGGRVSWTPASAGGTWSYDSSYLSMVQDDDAYTFKALKVGSTTATYTVNGVSHTVNITINESTIPQTGDNGNVMPWLLMMLTALCGIGAILLIRKKKEHEDRA